MCLLKIGQISLTLLFHKLISNSVSEGKRTDSCNGGFLVTVAGINGIKAQQ